MDFLMFNAVLRIESDDICGFFRVVAVPPGGSSVWLATIGKLETVEEPLSLEGPDETSLMMVETDTLEALESNGSLRPVDLHYGGRDLCDPGVLTEARRSLWDARRAQAVPFLDPERVCRALTIHGSVAPLIRQSSGSRATAYRLWNRLCVRGFSSASLRPDFDRCGNPGEHRPSKVGRQKPGAKTVLEKLGESEPNPQRGILDGERTKIILHARALIKPGIAFRKVYLQLIERLYVTDYRNSPHGLLPVLPRQGTYPNSRQIRHIVETGIAKMEKVRLRTTEGHFKRNLRGLIGRMFDGVPGPGHAYAIDSTIGDLHLRSSILRACPIGRPIVYILVDIWSTAVVGFYVCLTGPSWETAKLALFSGCCDQRLLASLWGYEYVQVLTPQPTLPAHLWTDRGEYVSAGARQTCEMLSLELSIDPPYRPELKGMVEVLHRIAKDEQFGFVPGAIDARRRELELRPNAKLSVMVLRDYVHYLHSVFNEYNLCADRRDRMTSEMIAAGGQPTPAGLWRFGHEAGFGFRRADAPELLMAHLLRKADATVRRDGIFLENLQYEAAIAAENGWTAQARHDGHFTQSAFHFPGSVSKFWWADPAGSMHEFGLRSNARAPEESTLDEWRDALEFERSKRASQEHRRLEIAAENMAIRREIVSNASKQTAEADASYVGTKLNSREARALENLPKSPPPLPVAEPSDTAEVGQPQDPAYNALMDQIFSELSGGTQ
jgi:putative transposase